VVGGNLCQCKMQNRFVFLSHSFMEIHCIRCSLKEKRAGAVLKVNSFILMMKKSNCMVKKTE
jgi:hypothetical protein